jgi:hypothetical protein
MKQVFLVFLGFRDPACGAIDAFRIERKRRPAVDRWRGVGSPAHNMSPWAQRCRMVAWVDADRFVGLTSFAFDVATRSVHRVPSVSPGIITMLQYRYFCFCFYLLVGLAGINGASRADEPVTIESQPGQLVVRIQGREFTVFHYGDSLKKPYFWPVNAQDGAILTRPIDPDEKEHPHHKGIWLSLDEVNDIRFWVERGKIATREVRFSSGNPAQIHVRNEWLGHDQGPTMVERTTISIYPQRLMIYDVTLERPVNQLVRLDDTKEGFFGIRIAQSMREQEGGLIINSEGRKTELECWGQAARWVDYTGPVGEKTYGVTIMDHPSNFRPSRYLVRAYGLFATSPFGEGVYQNDKDKAKPVILDDARPSLRIRYGLRIHDGVAAGAELMAAYHQFLETTKQLDEESAEK